ncbi:MAG: DUF1800 family protein [Roseomonas sp.]|nr:DUF1800 family protein [Roseomonas sp.]
MPLAKAAARHARDGAISSRRQIAPIRFGSGLRLGEEAPADPEARLERQIASPAAPPNGVGTAEAMRARAESIRQNRAAPPQDQAMGAPPPNALQALVQAESHAWAAHRLASAEPFRDRLVDLWANHFTVSRRSGLVGALAGALEREAIRPHVTGRFADMLVAVTRHPAMLGYLDAPFREGMRARGFADATLGMGDNDRERGSFPRLAAAAGRLLAEAGGPRVAMLDLGGWDTHAQQIGRMEGPLRALDAGLAALAGGRVAADWPGLARDKLFEDRDLQPTTDLRAIAKALLRDHPRLPDRAVAQAFPGSDAVAPLRGLLRA